MSSPASPLKVFLADGSTAVRERVAALLSAAGMAVAGEGATAESCIPAILACQPDVVVLDVRLEGGSGFPVLQQVRAQAPRIPIVVFTNHSGPGYRRRCLLAGAAAFLDKSSDFMQLAAVAKSACHACAAWKKTDPPPSARQCPPWPW
jgi:DNA-binding NarL/FixJ family response regulator